MSRDEAQFGERVQSLPYLGVGISTEYGASETGLDALELRRRCPELVQFLEIGCDLERGMDAATQAWLAQGWPSTYHFLDLNLEEAHDLEPTWVEETAQLARNARAAWICGDAGLWHIGPRERGHSLLAPPILEECSAREIGRNVARLRRQSGFEVLPENPPAYLYVGRMHLADYLSLVAEEGDCGILLDLAHYAIYQRHTGKDPFDGFERLPFGRIVEVHLAGGTIFPWQGRSFVDDDHSLQFLPELWDLFEALLERASVRRAVVLECERNPLAEVVPHFERIAAMLARSQLQPAPGTLPAAEPPPRSNGLALAHLQKSLVRMQVDAGFAQRILAAEPEALASSDLGQEELELLVEDPRSYSVDRAARRRLQLLGNLQSEFQLTRQWCEIARHDTRILDDFLYSANFHRAIRRADPLPFAFCDYLAALARQLADPTLEALLALERAMAQARRTPLSEVAPREDWLQLSRRHSFLSLPQGSLQLAEELKRQLVAHPEQELRPMQAQLMQGQEIVWIAAAARTSPYRLAPIEVAPLPELPGLADLVGYLREARPMAKAERYASQRGIAGAQWQSLLAEGLREGILIRGSAVSSKTSTP